MTLLRLCVERGADRITTGCIRKNGTVAIFPNIYDSSICPDGRKIVVTSGIEIAQNDRQVKNKMYSNSTN